MKVQRHEDQRLLLASSTNPCTYCPPKMGIVNKMEAASPEYYNPSYPRYWGITDSKEMLFDTQPQLRIQITGFSVCHPIY